MESHIIIDTDRKITVPDKLKRIAVQYDHNIETVTFDCPRYWDGNDLSEMTIYINYSIKNNTITSSYRATNICLDDTVPDIIHFDWTISRNVTNTAGKISFLVCIKKVDEEGNETHHWNSETNSDMYVSPGLEGSETIEEAYPDVLTSFDDRITINEEKIKVNETKINALEPKYSKDDIDPVFANNSWELIKWVSQYDDPAKYWKVGDYKFIAYPETTRSGYISDSISSKTLFYSVCEEVEL